MTAPDIRLEVLSKPKLLKPLRALLRCYVIAQGLAEEQAQSVVLAVDEACTNAIRHSYSGSPDGKLELLLRSTAEAIEIELADHGTPAPANCVMRKDDRTPDPDTIQPGGLGVQLIFTVFDKVEFYPGKECGNRVVMRLKRPAP